MGKTSGELYREARMKAASTNERLATYAGAAEELGVASAETIGRWERDETTPSNFNVRRMAQVYRAPELLQNYCATECPIGKGRVKPLSCSNFEQIAIRLFGASSDTEDDVKTLLMFAADGTIDDSEIKEFRRIIGKLGGLKQAIEVLQIFAEKKGI